MLNIHFLTLTVRDPGESERFIRTVFGVSGQWSHERQMCTFRVGEIGFVYCTLALLASEFQRSQENLSALATKALLSQNLSSAEEVSKYVDRALHAGGGLIKAPAPTNWGGFSGVVADPDGHLWEFVWNPKKRI